MASVGPNPQSDHPDQPPHAFASRSHQIHNPPPPIDTLPIETLSYIFQQLVKKDRSQSWDFEWYQTCLRQALALGSVSSHFRHVAFSTHDLWKRVPLELRTGEDIGKASSLLQLCIALARTVKLSVIDTLDSREDTRSAVGILLTPDTTSKVKSFNLYQWGYTSPLWMDKLNGVSCPILTTLRISSGKMESVSLDLGALITLTRLRIRSGYLTPPAIVPPSLNYLDYINGGERSLVTLLYQCPNLVECFLCPGIGGHEEYGESRFTKPLTLMHLKRLASVVFDAISTSSSVENLRLPSLELLKLSDSGNRFPGVIPLCRHASATLTSLIIITDSERLEGEDVSSLFRISFPRLTKLEFHASYHGSLWSVMYALERLERGANNFKLHHFPALQSLTLRCDYDSTSTYRILDFVRAWRALKLGEGLYCHIRFIHSGHCYDHTWLLQLRADVKSIVGSRQIEVTWGDDKIHEPGGR